jgi:cathepsin D
VFFPSLPSLLLNPACDTDVNVTMAFGGRSWSVSPDDMRVAEIGRNQCLGGFFEVDTGTTTPSWIVGDTFLKNVYTVFRYNPASVGFAELSSTSLKMNGGDDALPSATIGSVSTGVTASGRGGNGAMGTASVEGKMMMIPAVIVGLASFVRMLIA